MPGYFTITFFNTPSPLTRSGFSDPWFLFLVILTLLILIRTINSGIIRLPMKKKSWLIILAHAIAAFIIPFIISVNASGHVITLLSGIAIMAAALLSGPFAAILTAFFTGAGQTLFASLPVHEAILATCFTALIFLLPRVLGEKAKLLPESQHLFLFISAIATFLITTCEPVLGFPGDRTMVSAISLGGYSFGGSLFLIIAPRKYHHRPTLPETEHCKQTTFNSPVSNIISSYLLFIFMGFYAVNLVILLIEKSSGLDGSTLPSQTKNLAFFLEFIAISLVFIYSNEKKRQERDREITRHLADISTRRFGERPTRASDPVVKEIDNLEKSLRKMLFEQEKLITIARLISANQELFRIIHPILNAALEGTGALSARIAFLPQFSQEDIRKYVVGNFIRELDSYDGQLLQYVKKNGALVVNDLARAGSFNIEFPAGVTSLIALPLESDRSTYGILWLAFDSQRRMEAANFDFLFALAGEANVAITNTSLFEMLSEEHDKLEAVLLSMNDGLIVTDIQGRLLLVNATARKLFGIDTSGYQNRRSNEVFSDRTIIDFIYDFSGIQRSAELQIGTETFETKVSTIYNPNGRMLGRVINLSNITHLKELDSLKTVFLRMVSHDLRTYLNIILGFAELLEDSNTLNEDQQLSVQRILYGVNQIEMMVRQISRLSYLQFGEKASLAYDTIDLHDLIRGIVTEMTSAISKKRISVNLEMDELSRMVVADHVLLPQALMNLIQNAVKYTDPGGSITIRTFTGEDAQICIAIEDTGRGIDKKMHDKIFEPFFRIIDDNQPQDGQGLGLTLVRLIIELHGGEITVDSEIGRGSTFLMNLPGIKQVKDEIPVTES